jgi:hypothetical protein
LRDDAGCWILDAGWMTKNTLSVKSIKIEYPASRIQGQSLVPMASNVAAMCDFQILGNYGVTFDE